ncbi:MAG TPA: DUF481 domain-containing protein [Phycisphaeraceae bacterium]
MAALTVAAQAERVVLHSGEVLQGRIIEQTPEHVVLDHSFLGRLTIPAAQVAAIEPDSAQTAPTATAPADADHAPAATQPAEPPASQPAETEPPATQSEVDLGAAAVPPALAAPAPEEKKPSFFDDWKASIALGLAGSQGNSETQSFNAHFNATKETPEDRWLADFSYFLSFNNGERNQNELKADLTKDWLMPESPWFFFAQGIYQYDEFEAWEHRFSGFGGMGYTFVKNDRLELIGRGGVGATYEMGLVDELVPEALFGASILRWQLTDNQTLAASTTYYPALDDISEFRLVSSLEWSIKIDQADGLSLKLGINNEYESNVVEGKHNDFKYYGALVFNF